MASLHAGDEPYTWKSYDAICIDFSLVKLENFIKNDIKNDIFNDFCSKRVGMRSIHLAEAVLSSSYNPCFGYKNRKIE